VTGAKPLQVQASIGQCLICADLGLPGELHDNHTSYIRHWLEILKGDSSAIIHAAAKAEQAFGYLKGFGSGASDEQSEPASEDSPALKRAA
jgi:antirestriction protein ArdC